VNDHAAGKTVYAESDAWLMAALANAPRPVEMADLIGYVDYINRVELTFDEMSYGLQRLAATGMIDIVGDAVRHTAAAALLNKRLRVRSPGRLMEEWARLLNANGLATGDTTHGRLSAFPVDAYDAAIDEYHRRFSEAVTKSHISRDIREP
jgi:hypothetical protein